VAVLWLGIYGGIVLGGAMLLSYVNPAATVGGTLLNSVSAASNVGYSLTGLLDQKNILYAHCAIMLLGRVTPLMILWWIADTMPEVDVAIG
jgi:Trk-type K+ transport system membrane component